MTITSKGRVAKTFVYPVKGMQGIETAQMGLITSIERGVLGDRMHAIGRKSDMEVVEWKPKGMFHVAMNTPGIVKNVRLGEWDLRDNFALAPEALTHAIKASGIDSDSTTVINLDRESSFNLQDSKKPYVSFLNLASVQDLERALGIDIDPRRFRMNVWIEGLDPWVELDLVTQYETPEQFPMRVGPLAFGIDDLCERCKAVNQNPETGEFDIELMDLIDEYLRERGYGGSPHRNKHSVMGWLALPKSEARIYTGMPVTVG